MENLPSRDEVIKDGLDLGQINKALTEKIEEFTLHLIKKDKEITEVIKKQEILLKKIDKLAGNIELLQKTSNK